MRKFLVILQREYAQLVHKKSFLFTTLLTPVLMAVMMFLPAFLMQKGPTKSRPTRSSIWTDTAWVVKSYRGWLGMRSATRPAGVYTRHADGDCGFRLGAFR